MVYFACEKLDDTSYVTRAADILPDNTFMGWQA